MPSKPVPRSSAASSSSKVSSPSPAQTLSTARQRSTSSRGSAVACGPPRTMCVLGWSSRIISVRKIVPRRFAVKTERPNTSASSAAMISRISVHG